MHSTSIPPFATERGLLMGLKRAFEPAKTAAIAIDFQRFFIDEGQPMGNAHARGILDNANRVHAAVRKAGGLVVFTQHSMAPMPTSCANGEPPAQLVPEPISNHALLPGSASYEIHPKIERTAENLSVVKYQSSPLHPRSGTGLDEMLRKRGIEAVIITGLVTNGCCDCTARDAFQYGYNVVIATDATAAMTDEEHNGALLSLAIYYAQVMSADAIAAALA